MQLFAPLYSFRIILVIAELLLLQGTFTSWILGRRKKIPQSHRKDYLMNRKYFQKHFINTQGERETHAFVFL